jgi:hypothetical protein
VHLQWHLTENLFGEKYFAFPKLQFFALDSKGAKFFTKIQNISKKVRRRAKRAYNRMHIPPQRRRGLFLRRMFWGEWGLPPHPHNFLSCHLDTELDRETLDYYTDAGKIQISMLEGP